MGINDFKDYYGEVTDTHAHKVSRRFNMNLG